MSQVRDSGYDRIAATHPQSHQVADSVAMRFPLRPIAAADSATYPVVHAPHFLEGLANRIVTHPPAHVLRELHKSPLHRYAPAAPRQLANPRLKRTKRLLAPHDLASPEGEAEELEVGRSHDLALLLIHLQLELFLEEPPHARHHSLPSAYALHQYDEVIRVASEAMPAHLQFLVQIVEHHIGQQRRLAALPAPFAGNALRLERQLGGTCRSNAERACLGSFAPITTSVYRGPRGRSSELATRPGRRNRNTWTNPNPPQRDDLTL